MKLPWSRKPNLDSLQTKILLAMGVPRSLANRATEASIEMNPKEPVMLYLTLLAEADPEKLEHWRLEVKLPST